MVGSLTLGTDRERSKGWSVNDIREERGKGWLG